MCLVITVTLEQLGLLRDHKYQGAAFVLGALHYLSGGESLE